MEKWKVPKDELYTPFKIKDLDFSTTEDLEDMTNFLGQDRAYKAMEFGFGIRQKGFNLFAMGPSGSGKHDVVREFLEAKAANERIPPEWCYVNNFEQPHRPLYLKFPPSRANQFRIDMENCVEDLRSAIPSAFDSEEFRNQRQEIEEEFKNKQHEVVSEIQEKAGKEGISLVQTPAGFVFAPIRDGNVLVPEQLSNLPDEERREIEEKIGKYQKELNKSIQQQPKWQREAQNKIRELSRRVIGNTVSILLDELKRNYEDLPDVIKFIDSVRDDLVENAEQFSQARDGKQPPLAMLGVQQDPAESIFRRYQVNVLVDHSKAKGAPVIFADDPAFQNLVGRIEHIAQMGALTTDFTLIKPGALHRANGGYLMIDAIKVLMQPYAWEGLKRCLQAGEIQTESLGKALNLMSTVTLEPVPVPLDVKVVLIGERLIYYLLYQFDYEFAEYFKVAVDFEEDIDRTGESVLLFARWIATLVRRYKLMPFDRDAVGSIIVQASRFAGDGEKLSVQIRDLTDLLHEADHHAKKEGRDVVTEADVQTAIDARIYRMGRIRDRMRELIERGRHLIDTEGKRVGQINGLSVLQIGELMFGNPNRITARVRVGPARVIDIERESKLGGAIHSKGVLILNGFMSGRYLPDQPLTMLASLVFEQSYAGVEGDSASSAELYALLSALAEVPVPQDIAVTGSVNQHGEIQAVGGINQKVEGWFDVCSQRGLTGRQGVMIPAANMGQLMLRKEVVDACKEDKFHIYAVSHVDEGIGLLSGMPAGERDVNGLFPEGTFNYKVEERLRSFARVAREFAVRNEGDNENRTGQ